MTTRQDIADIIFPDIQETIGDLEKKYPDRRDKICSRVAPSPTWFLHIGVIFASLVPRKFCSQNKWTFILRIEDTDQKRLVEGWIEQIINWLKTFWIPIDEWPIGENNKDVWNYWPYIQSNRKKFYQIFVKDLISRWLAYPCRMTEQELEKTREQQTKAKVAPWIYGNYSIRRNKTPDEIIEKLNKDKGFVIRFRSHWDITKRIIFDDIIRGKITMNDNYNDIVLIKSDSLPTYHMAHIVDDHLMRVSHVIRAEEWLMSVPLHLQLFEACWLTPPLYCHVSQILKSDEGKKRKISKRKDPEANVEYFFENGFAPQWIIDYLLTIVDPFYEERLINNPDKNFHDYEIHLEKMNKSGALFDMIKLQSVNNNYLSKISTQDLYDQSLFRANKYKPDLAKLMESDPEYTQAALNIERHTAKDPKRFTTFLDVENQLRFFYDSERIKLISNVWLVSSDEKKETRNSEPVTRNKVQKSTNITLEVIKTFINEYIQVLDLTMTVEDRFTQLKEIWKKYWFASNNAEFKEWWYNWKTWDLAMIIRTQLCCTNKTPDLYSLMQVMWKDRVISRLKILI